ncbi:MAG: acyl carrier protein [Candidatus Omnitrophota bacterium]
MDIKVEVIEIISNLGKIPKENIEKYNKESFTELGLDSFSLVEIIFAIENKFEIDIPQDSLATIKNLDDLVALIQKLSKKNA